MIFIKGMECPLCNNKINDTDEMIGFPPITSNKKDPLWIISDSAIHKVCYDNFLYKNEMEKVLNLYANSMKTKKRNKCDICNEQIIDPDEFFTLGYLTFNENDELYKFNFFKLHKKCISQIKDVHKLLNLLENFKLNSDCYGEGLNYFIRTIEENI